MNKTIFTQVGLTPLQYKTVNLVREVKGLSMAEQIRRALDQYLIENHSEEREQAKGQLKNEGTW